jgi:hypothetical protein
MNVLQIGIHLDAMALTSVYFRAPIASLLLFCGCGPTSPPGFKEQILQLSTDPLKSYPALFSVDRAKMGFPPPPTNGTVKILTVDRKNWKLEYPPQTTTSVFNFMKALPSIPTAADSLHPNAVTALLNGFPNN